MPAVEDVIESEAKLRKVGKNMIYGDAVYLGDKRFISINTDEGRTSAR